MGFSIEFGKNRGPDEVPRPPGAPTPTLPKPPRDPFKDPDLAGPPAAGAGVSGGGEAVNPFGRNILYINPLAGLIYQAIAALTETFLPDVGAWVNDHTYAIGPTPVQFPRGLGFNQKRQVTLGIPLAPIPIPEFDSGLALTSFLGSAPQISIGELTFSTLSKNAVQISSKEFVMDVKPVEWQMIESLYGIKIYSSDEWAYKANQNYPGWRAKVYNGLYDPHTQELNARWSYRSNRRVG